MHLDPLQDPARCLAVEGRCRSRPSPGWFANRRTASRSSGLIVAIVVSVTNAAGFIDGRGPSWASSGTVISAAGVWALAVSNTLYWFLLLRLVWKHLIWTAFLSSVARCRLRLVVTHPDGHGGLGFIGLYPAGYALFTLSVSSVAAAGIAHVMQREPVTPALFTVVCAGWLVVVVLYFVTPLAGLAAVVGELKRRTILQSLVKTTDFERWNERAVLDENVFGDEAEPVAGEFRDAKPVYLATLKTSALLVNKANLLPILAPALLPFLVVGAFFLPYSQLGSIAKRLLLL